MAAITFTPAHPFAALAARCKELMNRYAAHRARQAEYYRVMNELLRLTDRELYDMDITRSDFDAIASGRYTR